ncbi:MAG: hypothetical protein IJQ63_04585 [Synergistaceae bacterium]|nr:hypothetical protein [Synergistaceae bacterium]
MQKYFNLQFFGGGGSSSGKSGGSRGGGGVAEIKAAGENILKTAREWGASFVYSKAKKN